jgi:hypothetical protein
MAFPKNPTQNTRHVEGETNFLADSGQWERNDEGLIVVSKTFTATTSKQSMIILPQTPQSWMTFAMVLNPKKTWAMRLVLYDVHNNFISQDSFKEGGFTVDGGSGGTETANPVAGWGAGATGGIPLSCWAAGWEMLYARQHFLEMKILPAAADHEREIIVNYRLLLTQINGHCQFTTGVMRFGGNFTELKRVGVDMDDGLFHGTVNCRYF